MLPFYVISLVGSSRQASMTCGHVVTYRYIV